MIVVGEEMIDSKGSAMEKPSNHRLTPRVEYFPRLLKPLGYFLLGLSAFKLYLNLGLTIHPQPSRWLAASRETAPDLLGAISCFGYWVRWFCLGPMGPLFPLYFPDSFTPGQLVKFDSEKKRWRPIT